MGCAGSGKGTLSKFITHNFSVLSIPTSRLLAEDGHLQKLRNGDLVNDVTVSHLVGRYIMQHREAGRFLGDGSIRSVGQANLIPRLLTEKFNFRTILTINLECSREVAIHRMDRRELEEAGTRHEKNDQVRIKRLDEYNKVSKQIKKVVSNYGPVIDVDADKGIEDVVDFVTTVLGKFIDRDSNLIQCPKHGLIPKIPFLAGSRLTSMHVKSQDSAGLRK